MPYFKKILSHGEVLVLMEYSSYVPVHTSICWTKFEAKLTSSPKGIYKVREK